MKQIGSKKLDGTKNTKFCNSSLKETETKVPVPVENIRNQTLGVQMEETSTPSSSKPKCTPHTKYGSPRSLGTKTRV